MDPLRYIGASQYLRFNTWAFEDKREKPQGLITIRWKWCSTSYTNQTPFADFTLWSLRAVRRLTPWRMGAPSYQDFFESTEVRHEKKNRESEKRGWLSCFHKNGQIVTSIYSLCRWPWKFSTSVLWGGERGRRVGNVNFFKVGLR